MKLFSIMISLLILTFNSVFAQFPWPITPFHESHEITGTFCEFRDTGSADHFHNGTDIPKPDGSPVYPVKDGIVTYIEPSGTDAYVRVQDMAYVHIRPNPSLSPGDSVFASRTVLGTILTGQGHVHLINGYYDGERNAMLEKDGLSPLNDYWAPIIRFVRFYENNTTNQFPSNKLSGLVDIIVKIDEQNAPPYSDLSRRNNGTYKIGYKILSSDTSTVVYEPPNDGLRFKFDRKPNNSHVHRVFFDQLSSTTSHVYIVTNDITRDNYWNTTLLPPDKYIVMVFTEDTRYNTDTMYVNVEISETDLIAPAVPVLKFVGVEKYPITISWYPNSDEDLVGYRLYYSYDNVKWYNRLDENTLTKTWADTGFVTTLSRDIYFKLTAVDNAPIPNESIASDVYGVCSGDFSEKVLIVDGFDRIDNDGSWHEPSHYFVFIHGQAITANGFGFDSASNDAVIDSSIDLNKYKAIIWILGDESIGNETFSSAEQSLLKNYLENGGMLFVSGSEIAWELDQDSDAYGTTLADEQFLHDYLKADYAGNNSAILSVSGVNGTIFEGLKFGFGTSPYPEDSPDYINPFGEGVIVNLKYNESKNAGIQYSGIFGKSTKPGKLIYFAFPFETITGDENRQVIMGKILDYFFPSMAVYYEFNTSINIPKKFALLQNYPNPFNPVTMIEYHLPITAHVTIIIYNLVGQKVCTLLNQIETPGLHRIVWDGFNEQQEQVSSGIYFVQMIGRSIAISKAYDFHDSKRIIFMR